MGAFGIFGARYFWHTSFNTRGVPLEHCRGGSGSSPHPGLDQQKAPPEETGLEGWQSCEESFSGLNLTWGFPSQGDTEGRFRQRAKLCSRKTTLYAKQNKAGILGKTLMDMEAVSGSPILWFDCGPSFRPDLRGARAVARSGCQGRPVFGPPLQRRIASLTVVSTTARLIASGPPPSKSENGVPSNGALLLTKNH